MSAVPYQLDRDKTGVPVACSKCNETIGTDSDYLEHYNGIHTGTKSVIIGLLSHQS